MQFFKGTIVRKQFFSDVTVRKQSFFLENFWDESMAYFCSRRHDRGSLP